MENGQAIAPAPAAPAGPGFVVPTQNAEGTQLDARGQLAAMSKNEAWARDALLDGTQAREQFNDLNRRIAESLDSADANPVLTQEPATKASDYQIPMDVTGNPDADAFDVAARSWLLAGGVPAKLGSSLAQHLEEVGRKLQGADDITLARHDRESRAALEKIYGDDLNDCIETAAQFLEEIEGKEPGILELVDLNQHVFRDALVLHQLIGLADAYFARKDQGA